jgi:hypothetical protein
MFDIILLCLYPHELHIYTIHKGIFMRITLRLHEFLYRL